MAAHRWHIAYHRVLGWRAPALRRTIAVLVVGLIATTVLVWYTPWQLAAILGWDAAALTFLGSAARVISRADGAATRRLATMEDDTRTAADVLVVVACVVSLFDVGFAIGLAGQRSGGPRVALIAVAALTLGLSWTLLNVSYTLRYTHLYYGAASGGIDFNSIGVPAEPSYRDFAYVAFTVGMTYQVSDTALRHPGMRRTVLSHAAVAYAFGVVIIAGAINLIAGLIR